MINVDGRNLYKGNVDTSREGTRARGWLHAAGAAAVAATLTACSSFGNLTGSDSAPSPAPASRASTTPAPAASPAPASSNTSFTSRIKALFASDSGNPNSAAAPQPVASDIECPSVEYRQGAATMAVNNPGSENALDLRYQASFTQSARECILRGNNLNIKVGVQGRIVLGPAGGPGSVSIPLRYALVREGLEPKTLWTKLFMVPVTITENQLNLPWIHVEEEMTVPRPSDEELEAYVIYIGFDPQGATAPKAKSAAKPRAARTR